MALDYYTIDSKKYLVMWENYKETWSFPKKIERTLSGDTVVFFPQGQSFNVIELTLILLPSPPSGYGTYSDLRSTYEKRSQIQVTTYRNDDARTTFGATITDIQLTEISPLATQGMFVNIVLESMT